MAGNTAPIYSKVGDIQWGTLTAANTTKDGTGGTPLLVFAADATNGGRLEKIKVRALGTNVATVARVFINNGSSLASAANNSLFYEQTIAATTVSEVAAQVDNEITLGGPLVLPPGYRVYITIGTAVAAGLAFTAVGGKY
jgi:hypothetical protein